MKICIQIPNLVKLGQHIRHFTWRPNYVLLWLVSWNCHKCDVFDWNGIRLLVHPFPCPPVCPPVCPHVSAWLPVDVFILNSILWPVWKSVKKFQICLKLGGKKSQALYMMTKVCYVIASNITCHRRTLFWITQYQALRMAKQVTAELGSDECCVEKSSLLLSLVHICSIWTNFEVMTCIG